MIKNLMRSGISIAKQQTNRQVVSPSEIMRLKDLEAYVRLPGGFPITKVSLSFKNQAKISEPFITRKIDERNFNKINTLLESAENALPPKQVQLVNAKQENLEW